VSPAPANPSGSGSGPTARYPGRAAIDAYGNGGFRFAGMSHKGSILCLPSGIYAWDAASPADITAPALARVLDETDNLDVLLIGTGGTQVFAPMSLRRLFDERAVALEAMSTGAAARTYNVLLAEERPVAAALLAVD
jgi:uncharacterized protein